jgi:hypothetical protein
MKLSRNQVQSKAHAIPELRFEDQKLTSFAGLFVFQLLFQRLDLKNRLRHCFRHLRSNRAYDHALAVLGLIVHLLIGFRQLRDVRYLNCSKESPREVPFAPKGLWRRAWHFNARSAFPKIPKSRGDDGIPQAFRPPRPSTHPDAEASGIVPPSLRDSGGVGVSKPGIEMPGFTPRPLRGGEEEGGVNCRSLSAS